MGLIRITGGVEGLAEYLERGEKKGRRQTRDQLDERVVLAGDLELTDTLIKSMSTKGDRFLHITFSLKEDSVPLETLQGIVRDFEKFAFSAFRKDEYNYYAEAHLPKIKSVSDEFLGSDIVRLPHIHIVVPKVNLLTGETLNPFGWTVRCIKHIDAFQELTNHKYGLASPKENRRNGFFEHSEIIGGLSGTEFEGRGERLKFKILRSMLERKIGSMEDFRALLKEFGEITIRNHGQKKEVLSVKPEGSKKDVELLDHVFAPVFILLKSAQKSSFLSDQYGTKDFDGIDPTAKLEDALKGFRNSIASNREQRKELKKKICAAIVDHDITTVEAFRKLLKEFGTTRTRNAGRENEYENIKPLGNAKGINLTDYEFSRTFIELSLPIKKEHLAKQSAVKYEAMSEPREPPKELLDTLDDWKKTRSREVKFLNSGNRTLWKDYQEASPERRAEILDKLEMAFARRLESLRRAHQVGPHGIESGEAEKQIHRPSSLLASGVSADRKDGGGYSSEDEIPAKTEVMPISPGHDGKLRLRRPNESNGRHTRPVRPGTGRRSDSVVGQLARDLNEKTVTAASAEDVLIAEIKNRMDASALLNVLSKTHGLIIEKYSVSSWPDGSQRIKCGTRIYPVNDFLTKEMHFSWHDAEVFLRTEYTRQQQNRHEEMPRRQPDRTLWAEFQKDKPVPSAEQREEETDAQRLSESRRWQEIADQKSGQEPILPGNTVVGVGKSNAALSVPKIPNIPPEKALRRDILIERQQLRNRHRRRSKKEYREWLIVLAENDERALVELRRINIDLLEIISVKGTFGGNRLSSAIIKIEKYKHCIHSNGDVSYHRDGICAFRDTAEAVLVFETKDQDVEFALRVAIHKFGSRLELTGDQDFQIKVAKIAAEAHLDVEFDDSVLNGIKERRSNEIAAELSKWATADEDDGHLVGPADTANVPDWSGELIPDEQGGEFPHPTGGQRVDENSAGEEVESEDHPDDDDLPTRPRI